MSSNLVSTTTSSPIFISNSIESNNPFLQPALDTNESVITAQSIEQLQYTHISSPHPRAPVNTDINSSTGVTPPSHASTQQYTTPLPSLARQYTTEDDHTEHNATIQDSINNAFPSAVLPPQTVTTVVADVTQPHPIGADVETNIH